MAYAWDLRALLAAHRRYEPEESEAYTELSPEEIAGELGEVLAGGPESPFQPLCDSVAEKRTRPPATPLGAGDEEFGGSAFFPDSETRLVRLLGDRDREIRMLRLALDSQRVQEARWMEEC